MATRKSKNVINLATREAYVTVPLEDRVRHLEKRHRQSDRTRAWKASWAFRATVGAMLYLTTAMLLGMILIPGWYVCALVPVIGYATGLLALSLVRNLWEDLRTKR